MKLSFVVPGVPQAKQRGRMILWQQCDKCSRKRVGVNAACTCGGHMKPLFMKNMPGTETVQYENLVKLMAHEAMQQAGINEPMGGLLKMTVEMYFPIPESRRCNKDHSLSERNGCKKLHDGDWHGQRPDYSNVLKAVEDGCNAVVYLDDAQCVRGEIEKHWSVTPRCCVTVESLC